MESHCRSIVKAMTWRVIATVVTTTVAWLVTRQVDFAAKIGVLDAIVKIGAFYAHERLWNRLSFGKLKRPEYEI